MGNELNLRSSRTVVAREATYNTDQIAVDIAADSAMRYEAFTDVAVTMNGDFRERNITRPNYGNNRGRYSPRNLGWTVNGIIPAPATAGNAPLGLDNWFVGAGFTETLVASTTSTYERPAGVALDQAGLTVYHWLQHKEDYTWRLIYGTGIRNNLTFAASAREYATWTATGESANFPVDSTVTSDPHGWSLDQAFFGNFTAGAGLILDKDGVDISVGYVGTETTDDPRGLILETDSIITVNAVPYPISAFSIDLGNTITVKERTSSTSTVGPVCIVDAAPTLELTLDRSGAGFEDAVDALHAQREASATLVLSDGLSTGGTRLTITVPDLQIRDVAGPNDAAGTAAWTIPCQANTDWPTNQGGGSDITFVWSVTP